MREYKNVTGDRNCDFILRVVCGCLLFVPMKALAANDPNTSASNSTYNAEIVKEEKAKDSCKLTVFTLEITDKTKHEVARVTFGGIGERIRSIKKLYLFENNKLVVHGNLERADIIYVVDCETDNVVDMFWCYDPVLGPSKRFWVYEKFYAPHEMPATRTTVVLVYDMRKAPAENRVPVVGYTAWPKEQVGFPIYPEPYVKARAYVLREEQLQNPNWYNLSSPFLWSPDANDVVFLCNHKKQTYIVRINISAGIDRPKIFEAPVNVGSFVNPDLREEYKKNEAARLHMVSATEIHWDGKDHVIAKPNKAYYTLQEKIRLSVP